MGFSSSLIFWVALHTKGWPRVISLMFIWYTLVSAWSSCLWQSPPGEIFFCRRIHWSFWNVSARTNSIGSGSLVFESASSSSSETETVFLTTFIFRFLIREILWPWGLFEDVHLHSGLSSNFRSSAPFLSCFICSYWVILETDIFIKVIFSPIAPEFVRSSKVPTRWPLILKLILVVINWSRR